jgi:hypothetical protein
MCRECPFLETDMQLCRRCNIRPGTERWASDATSAIHGWVVLWCKRCCVEEQIIHARKCAAELPMLEKALAGLEDR